MNKQVSTVPKLRFPEFVKEGEWEYLNGNKLFEPISNKNHNSDLPILATTQDQGAIPRAMIDYRVFVSDKSVKSYKVVEVGDFIISLRSFQGGIEYSKYLGLCSPAYIILRKKLDVLNNFYRYYFKSFPFIHDLNKNLEGIRDGKMISYKQFSDILIPKPKKQEQQKIADCLSSLDALITTQTQKLQALQQHKKGLMQNFFPTEGKTTPKLRFPEFVKEGEWEYLNGNKLFEPISNKNHNSDLPILATTQDQGAIPRAMIDYRVFVSDKSVKSYKVVEVGDFIISLRSFQGGIEYSKYLGLCSPAYIILRKKLDVLNNFYRYYFKSFPFIHDLNKNLEGIRDGKMISYKQFSDILIPKPKKQEQQKIADCLSSLDALITTQTQKLQALQQHKKGLMQQLFIGNKS